MTDFDGVGCGGGASKTQERFTSPFFAAFYNKYFPLSPLYFIIFSLVDLTFCQRALTCKINIKEQMCNYIGPQTQLFTTSCILSEGALLGPQLHGALLICKQYKLRKCPHKDEPVSAQECIQHMIGIIAQDFSCLYAVKKIQNNELGK